jgi:hypothetical protein
MDELTQLLLSCMALVLPIVWMVTMYRLVRLPYLPHRWLLVVLACIPVPIPDEGGTMYEPVFVPLVLLITYLRPGRKIRVLGEP